MIEPVETDVGRKVIYQPYDDPIFAEEGVITSFTDSFVFVRYGKDTHSKATSRGDLYWLQEKEATS